MVRRFIHQHRTRPMHRRFLAALVLSLLLHCLIIIGFDVPLHDTYGNTVLEVQFKPLASTKRQSLLATTTLSTSTSAVPIAALQPSQQGIQNDSLQTTSAPTPLMADVSPTENLSQTVASMPSAATPVKSDRHPLLPVIDPLAPASLVDIEYEIFTGENGKSLGTARQHYQSDTAGNYQIRYQNGAEETPGSWQVEINGTISGKGLTPSNYSRQGQFAKELVALSTVGDESKVNEVPQSGRMPDGILDRFSMLYQFMHVHPTSDEGKLWLTDGEKVGEYDYHILGYESIDIKSQGIVNTMHMKLTRNDDPESTELWLAIDYHYLPIRIRRLDKSGIPTDQVAVSLIAQ